MPIHKDCPALATNRRVCTCTYEPCSRKGNCCACLQYHLASDELPGCCFPADVERTYDRSFRRFIAARGRSST
jgi:hypothetical protein